MTETDTTEELRDLVINLRDIIDEKQAHILELQEQILQILDKNNEQAKTIRRLEDALAEAHQAVKSLTGATQ
jgi:uncharacterized coiled-coil protein SlyX